MTGAMAERPASRTDTLGRSAPTPPLQLTARQLLLISYQVDGCPIVSLCTRIWVERTEQSAEGPVKVRRHPHVHEPLALMEAAEILGIKRRHARHLMTMPIFQHAYNAELQRYRDGERAANLHRMVAIRDDPGLNKAADRKVQLQAAALLNGDMPGKAGTTVNVSVGGMPLVAGIVIDLRDDDEIEATTTIEHEEHR